jgi:hypothetical protein
MCRVVWSPVVARCAIPNSQNHTQNTQTTRNTKHNVINNRIREYTQRHMSHHITVYSIPDIKLRSCSWILPMEGRIRKSYNSLVLYCMWYMVVVEVRQPTLSAPILVRSLHLYCMLLTLKNCNKGLNSFERAFANFRTTICQHEQPGTTGEQRDKTESPPAVWRCSC